MGYIFDCDNDGISCSKLWHHIETKNKGKNNSTNIIPVKISMA